jgi:DNA-binding response OmpR family regulator
MERFHRSHAQAGILVIEPDALFLTAIGGALDLQGHKVILARTESVAQQALQSQSVDLIVLSIDHLEDGCQFAARLRQSEDHAEIPIIFIVPEMSRHWAASLQEQGGVFCILRSLDPNDLIDLVDKALWMPHVARRASPPPSYSQTAKDWVKLDWRLL